jgi:uncharacterized membrane protein YkoI
VPAALLVAVVMGITGCQNGDSGSEEGAGSAETVTATATATETQSPTESPTPSAASPEGEVGEQEARRIALRTAGSGRVEKIEADEEDGRPVWKVEVRLGADQKRKIEIDRGSGKVVKNELDD